MHRVSSTGAIPGSGFYRCAPLLQLYEGYRPGLSNEQGRFTGRSFTRSFCRRSWNYQASVLSLLASGATPYAVPAMAKTAAHVTHAQLSPSYGCWVPGPWKMALRRVARNGLPDAIGPSHDALGRNVCWASYSTAGAREARVFSRGLLHMIQDAKLGQMWNAHLRLRYQNPGDQRGCAYRTVIFSNDVRAGRASVVTRYHRPLYPQGIRLTSART